MSSAKLTTRT